MCLDIRPHARIAPIKHVQNATAEPIGAEASRIHGQHGAAIGIADDALKPKPRTLQINAATAIAQIGRAMGLEQTAQWLHQLVNDGAHLDLEPLIGRLDPSDRSAIEQDALGWVVPIDQPCLDGCMVIQTCHYIGLCHTFRNKRTQQYGFAASKARQLMCRLHIQPAARLMRYPAEYQIIIMLGKTQHHAIAPHDTPAQGMGGGITRQALRNITHHLMPFPVGRAIRSN